jgi:hypothetical protein
VLVKDDEEGDITESAEINTAIKDKGNESNKEARLELINQKKKIVEDKY